jgi:hypothetical protein
VIDELKKLLEQVSDPADAATVLIAGTAGFLVDAGLNVVGFLEPGYVGITAAAGALGVKKAAQAGLAKRREQKAREQNREAEKKRAKELRTLLSDEEKYQDLAQRLQQELKLFEAGIIDAEELKASVNEIVKGYRDKSNPVHPTWPARKIELDD